MDPCRPPHTGGLLWPPEARERAFPAGWSVSRALTPCSCRWDEGHPVAGCLHCVYTNGGWSNQTHAY